MLVGPVFAREATTAPRRARFYVLPTLYVATLFGLMLTSWQILVGNQHVQNPGDLARFGAAVFAILAPLQLAVAMPFSALLSAAAVAQEKDRRTLDLLLMTNLSNIELVLGKLLASMLEILVVLAAAVPLFVIATALGGVSYGQIARVFAVTLLAALVAGSLGSTVALWREKTFQALAVTTLAIVLWLVAWELVAGAARAGWLSAVWRDLPPVMSPWRAVLAAAQPFASASEQGGQLFGGTTGFLLAASVATVAINLVAVAFVRRWNPSREARPQSANTLGHASSEFAGDVHSAGGHVRHVWDNPILWREMRTWAYGKKILIVHVAYWTIFAVCAAALVGVSSQASELGSERTMIPAIAMPLTPLLVVSLILLNALAVTSLTNERDGRALDLLLVTDLTPKEIIFGKLGGAFYNAKEMFVLPLLLVAGLWWFELLTTENLVFLLTGLTTLFVFVATLGLHCGMTYQNSRAAIATSIGTLLFLFLGVATCMRIMLAFSASFEQQLAPFLGVVGGGGAALYAALGFRNPSRAMGWAFIPAPFLTFFAMTSYLMGDYGTVFLITTATYAFATAAMLMPAIAEFDVATGRTVAHDG